MRQISTLAALSLVVPATALVLVTIAEAPALPRTASPAASSVTIQPNPNLRSGGTQRGNVLELSLVADTGQWKPADDRPTIPVAAFREEGKPLQNPGPMIRVRAGTEVRVTLRNALAHPLYVWGLATRPAGDLTPILLAAGETRELRFDAGEPGTYLYYARRDTLGARGESSGYDSQLNGAFIVDRPGARQARGERVFVLSLIETHKDTAAADSMRKVGIWLPAINGRTWPFTERLTAMLGEKVAWRWINGTDRVHPMHLHGFFFDVNAKGTWARDTIFAERERYSAVTEIVFPRGTMDMTWTPERVGNWLMHCHMIPHVMPFWTIPGQKVDVHTHEQHAERAMAGLVLGITVRTRHDQAAPLEEQFTLSRQLRLIAQEARTPEGTRAVSYILQRGNEPRPDSVQVPGLPIVLRRDEPVAITVVNRMREPTSVHWHGIELESYYDGVAGWSGADRRVAPLIAPGDSFVVRMVPPRTGTYMYHSHMDERDQVVNGAYGPLIVLEPFDKWDPETDRTLMIGEYGALESTAWHFLLNGRRAADTLTFSKGKTYRLRIMNMAFAAPQIVTLLRDSTTMERWTPLAKDGAPVTGPRAAERPARLMLGVGETYDFSYTPTASGVLRLRVATRDALWLTTPVKVE